MVKSRMQTSLWAITMIRLVRSCDAVRHASVYFSTVRLPRRKSNHYRYIHKRGIYGKVDAVERIVLIYIMDIQQVKRAYSR